MNKLIFTLVIALLLTACAPTEPDAISTITPENGPTMIEKTVVMVTLTPEATPTPQPNSGKPLPAAADAAVQAIARQQTIAVEKITVQSITPVDWPDGCLGAAKPGTICTQAIVPGFRVMLVANGKTYEVRTDQDGGMVVPINGLPTQPAAQTNLVWQATEGGLCTRAEISTANVQMGKCGAALSKSALDAGRAEELAALTAHYRAFFHETPAGTVQFQGQGQQEPTPAEMRSIAEWASLVAQEANGSSSPAQGLAMAWHQEGGIAGLCNDLNIYRSGWAIPTSCKAGQAASMASYRLTDNQLAQMYTWVDGYKNFEFAMKDPATADAMKTSLTFTGSGSAMPSADQQTKIADFAAQVFAEKSR